MPATRLHTFHSYDGTRIAYRVVGDDPAAPWLILAHGYGGTFSTWEPIAHRLADRFQILMWDYRGMHTSGTPADPARLRIEDHVRDLTGIVQREGIESAWIGGWSVGVQVALEAWSRLPLTKQGLFLVCGAYERILHEANGGSRRAQLQNKVLVRAVAAANRVMPLARRPVKRIVRLPFALPLAERLGICTGQPPELIPAIESILDLDLRRYMQMVRLADDHRTSHFLGDIDVPVLVVAGGRDPLTPAPIARRLVERLQTAELMIEPAGTHYTVVEFPGEVAAAFRRFADARST